jgi:glycosyltransferase involved in cell wall biosynthesis
MNTNRFKPDPTQREQMRSEYGATDNFIVLIVAYLVHEKGVDIVIKALSLLPEGINLWIVGGGKEYDNLHELCHKLKVAHRVRFFGHQQDIQRFTQAADCFVCPSRWEEAAGLVLLEAQSSGLPTLGSCRGGIPEYISDGNTGYLFRPEDEKQLAAQIRLLYENPLLYHKLQTEARAWVYRNFSHETQLDNYLHIYARDITG